MKRLSRSWTSVLPKLPSRLAVRLPLLSLWLTLVGPTSAAALEGAAAVEPDADVNVRPLEASGTEAAAGSSPAGAAERLEAALCADVAEPWDPGPAWGGLSLGLVLTPVARDGIIRLTRDRVSATDLRGWGDEGAARSLLGADLRWWFFSAAHRGDFPRAEGYFRTGVTRGRADFLPRDDALGFQTDDATQLSHLTVPVFVGGNLYLFERFPVRPLLGAGLGFDVLRVAYERSGRSDLDDVSLRVGFELHAGLEARVTNFVGFVAEARHQWGARNRLAGVPDYANRGLTITLAIKAGFPLQSHADSVRQRARRAERFAAKRAKEAPPRREVGADAE